MFNLILIKFIIINNNILKKEQKLDNKLAIDFSFFEVLNSRDDKNLVELKNNCIKSGLNIHVHLERWFQEFDLQDIFLIESGSFREDPIKYLNSIQEFFGLKRIIDYKDILTFNKNKLVFCSKLDPECSSFHSLPSIDENSLEILENIFKESNKRLHNLLILNNFETPSWIKFCKLISDKMHKRIFSF